MKIERMVYSEKALRKAVEMLKNLKTETPTKKSHWNVYAGLIELNNYCEENINACVFDKEIQPLYDYEGMLYAKNYKPSKKLLDETKKQAIRYIKSEIKGICDLVSAGDVDVIE